MFNCIMHMSYHCCPIHTKNSAKQTIRKSCRPSKVQTLSVKHTIAINDKTCDPSPSPSSSRKPPFFMGIQSHRTPQYCLFLCIFSCRWVIGDPKIKHTGTCRRYSQTQLSALINGWHLSTDSETGENRCRRGRGRKKKSSETGGVCRELSQSRG